MFDELAIKYVWFGIGVFVILGLLCLYPIYTGGFKFEKPLPAFGKVPNFALIDSDAKEFTGGQLQGKVWIADFIFTTSRWAMEPIQRRWRLILIRSPLM